jgi:hypothetical protein
LFPQAASAVHQESKVSWRENSASVVIASSNYDEA